MPKIRRKRVPRALLDHLYLRVEQRDIRFDQILLFSSWIDTDPTVPSGPWFKRFSGLTVCGEGELVKTFLRAGQLPTGTEIF